MPDCPHGGYNTLCSACDIEFIEAYELRNACTHGSQSGGCPLCYENRIMAKFDTHVVKSWCYLYSAAIAGFKTHDFRDMTERDYKVGDRMHFREFDQTKGEYTGREALFEITYITNRETPCAMSSCALDKKYCVLSIKLVEILKS